MPLAATATGATIQFRCLGPAQLTGPDGGPRALRTRKQLGLLLYLARRARAVGRDELIDLLWSETTVQLARHSLSQSCSLINKMLGAEVVVGAGRDRVALAEGAVWLDANAFERLVAEGRHDEALALWRGSLFEGLWTQRAPRFEQWLADERERLQRMFRRLAHARIEALRNAGDHAAMRDEAERLLQHDPLDEKAMHACLQALVLGGDRSLALRRYAEFEARLRKELDAEPGGALKSWAKRHRRGDGDVAERASSPAPRISEITVLPASQPFFGRTEEFSMLWKAWESTAAGTGAFIIIEGEAGIGKTALATKLVNQAHVAGGSVCFVKCYRTEKSVPFAPITNLIRQLSRLPGFVALDPIWIGELMRLVPELRERFPNGPQPMAVDDAARHRLGDATVSATLAVADELQLLIVVDDFQDADEASLALLHYLGRQTPQHPILLIGTARKRGTLGEFERTFVETADAAGFAKVLALGDLGAPEIERLVEQVLAQRGMQASPLLLQRIRTSCTGNPLAAVEASLAADHASLAGATNAGFSPGGNQQLLKTATERLAGLPRASLAVAQAITVAGRPLTDFELAEVTELGAAELAAGILSLETARFVRRMGSNIGLAHDEYVAVVLATSNHAEVVDIHRRLATLAAKAAAGNPAMRYEAARHYSGAGRTRRARRQALAAATYAGSVGAVRSKAEALEILASLGSGLGSKEAHDLCWCYLHLNDIDALSRLCRRLRTEKHPISSEVEFYEIAAAHQIGEAGFPETEARLKSFLELMPPEFSNRHDAEVMLIRIADKTGNYKLVRSLARSLRGSGLGAHALFAAAYVQLKCFWAHRALPLMECALAAARRESELEIEQLARDGVAILLKQVGRYRESIQAFDYSLGLARRTMNPHAEVMCLHNRAVSEMCLGDWTRVRATHAEAARIGVGFARWSFHLFRDYNAGLIWLCESRFDLALSAFVRVHSESLRQGLASLAREAAAGEALVHQRTGHHARLQEAAHRVRELGRAGVASDLSWIDHAALAYDEILNKNNAVRAIDVLRRRVRELARRDVSHRLALQLELIRAMELIKGSRCEVERTDLKELAQRYEAGEIERATIR